MYLVLPSSGTRLRPGCSFCVSAVRGVGLCARASACALSGLAGECLAWVNADAVGSAEKYAAFLAVLDRDADDTIRTIELVLAQPAISSQLIDNLNASMHLRAVLTDLFLLSDIASIARTSPAVSAIAG